MAGQISFGNDPEVDAALASLEARGFTLNVLMQSSEEDIDAFVPRFVTQLDALKLKIALRVKRKEIADPIQFKAVFERFSQFVGRVTAKWITKEGRHTTQIGSCVLVGNHGTAITALHVVADASASKGKGKGKRKLQIPEIRLHFPNTSKGEVECDAIIIDTDVSNDLALMRSTQPRAFQKVDYFARWSTQNPQVTKEVFLISFPSVLDKDFPSRRITGNLPCCDRGSVTYVSSRRALASYRSFEACSGGLVISPTGYGGGYGLGIHLSMCHGNKALSSWDHFQLSNLIKNLEEKGAYGIFTHTALAFLERNIEHNDGICLPQKMRIIEEQEVAEVVEEIDLFSPWPGLDQEDAA